MNNYSLYKAKDVFCYVFIIGFYLTCFASLAQTQQPTTLQSITGLVSEAKGPLPGVTVTVKGTTLATTTDENGKYLIKASAGDILVFSYVGYKEVTVTIGSNPVVNITMLEDATSLKEVTVNAGYYKVKDSERTGSIAKITSKDIEKQPVTNVLAAMQGRMAGVNITQTTGTPGGGFEIQIRGQNSLRLNGNNPLYIIDGVPYSADPIGSGMASAVLPTQPSPLNSINPDQIESIEVLKDADATAIYGSRGANGVVLITTKKGTIGKTRFTAAVTKGVGTVTRFMDLMNTQQYLAMRNQAYANDGVPVPSYAYDVNGTWSQNRYTDWQKELMGGTAEITDLKASVAGGADQTQFLLSGSFSKQTTVLPLDFAYKKTGLHLNVHHESINKKFSTTVTAGYTIQDNNQPRVDILREAVTIAPNAPALYQAEGSLNWENNTFNNPLRNLQGKYKTKTHDFIANGLCNYQLAKDWQAQTSIGYTRLTNEELTANPSTRYNPSYGLGPEYSTLIVGNANRESWIIEPQLNYNHSFGKGKLSVVVGSTLQSQRGNQLVQYASGFSSNSLIYNLASASYLFTIMSDETEYKYQALYGRVNYNWQEKYIINLTGRRDGSSRFGPGKQFATFGALGAAWLFGKENAFKNSTVLSFGKLRASYGLTGSDQIGDYQYVNTYASSGASYGGIVGLQPTHLFNPAFGWETNKKLEVALETGFLKDRLFFTAAWYDNRSSDQLTGVPLPTTTGFTSIQANLNATVQNTGVELTLRTVNVQNKEFSWTSNLNLTVSRNKVLSFPDLSGSTYANQYVVGQSLSIQKVYHYTGVDPVTGIYTFQDANGDGAISGADDKTTIVDFNPKYYGGFQNSFKYKNWQLDFLLQFVKQVNYNQSAFFGIPGSSGNQPAAIANHWQQPGDSAAYQVLTDGTNGAAVDAYYKFFESDGAISDASYVRLKNLSIAYDVPLKDFKCKLFFQGQNVLTFTHYRGADPEFKSAGYLPPLRVLSAGVQLSF